MTRRSSSLARLSLASLLACATLAGEAIADGPSGRVQTGYATYYSRSFDGDETASGETFDADAPVAAHRSLPFDSIVQVTNLENGRRAKVRIVDRGPYGKNWREGAIIDVSPAVAHRLGMVADGQVRVRLRVLKRGPQERSP